MLLLKTPGGSSFIWLLPNSLREDIPWFQLKVLFFLEIFAIAGFLFYFFCWINSLFVSCPDQTHAYASCKTSLFLDAFRLTVIDFFGEFCELMLNTCIKKPYYGYNGGQWPYRLGWTETGKVVEKLKNILGARWENIWGPTVIRYASGNKQVLPLLFAESCSVV